MPDFILNVAAGLFGIGAVYGLIRADLKNLHEKSREQKATTDTLFKEVRRVDDRINQHIDSHFKVH